MFYPPPPENRDKPKKFRNVRSALRASTLTALALLIALVMLLPNAAAEAQSSPTTATATATATPTDYDSDDDGLIDINNLAQLNAVRYDLDGDAKQDTVTATDWAIYTAAFSNPAAGMGCKPTDHDDDATTDTQPTCKGYELMRDLDFDTDGDGDVDASDTNSYPNWTPIGTAARPFDSKFEGSLTNGVMPKISNLTISGASQRAGLFGATGENAHIKNIGLVDVNIDITTSSDYADVGALAAHNAGRITACYSTGAITAAAGRYSEAGGLAGFNGGTIEASFSRATVYMSYVSTSSGEFYVGGLAGYNGGTIRAAYAAGAVKGKGNNSTGKVGGLAGYNVGTIDASYSIAPVTSVGLTPTATSKPAVLGLSFNQSGFSTVTNSYWDVISSGVPDDADTAMPEGKYWELMQQTPTPYRQTPTSPSVTSIYADWDDLTIDGANDVDPWIFDFREDCAFANAGSNGCPNVNGKFHPLLTYGGHTTAISGNQLFVFIEPYDWLPPTEGMRLWASTSSFRGSSVGSASGSWQWQSSTDGITWGSALVSNTVCGVQQDSTCGAAYRATDSDDWFIVRPELEGKYIRARAPLTAGGYAYTRVIGKVKLALSPLADHPGEPPRRDPSFTSGHNPPRVGTEIRVDGALSFALWQRCDDNTSTPQGCEYVGSRTTYTPGAGDLNHYLRVYTYGRGYGRGDPDDVWTRFTTGFTQKKVADIQRTGQWYTWR